MRQLSYLLLLLILTGCSPMATTERTLTQAEATGFRHQVLSAGNFKLTSLNRFSKPASNLQVYLEGDGHAWSSFTKVSPDPTPHQPLALQLAMRDAHSLVSYLARPCQYSLKQDQHCTPKYWTSHRFAPEVVSSLSLAIDTLKQQSGAKTVTLIGYSGGGGLCALLAAKRNDVAALITIAGDLDHKALSDFHHTTPQPESLNPIHIAANLSALPQVHFSGEKDTIVPPFIAASFISQQGKPNCAKQIVLKKVGHHKGWIAAWEGVSNTDRLCFNTN